MSNALLRLYVTAAGFVQARYGRKDRGATAVEYGLLVGLIAIAIIGTLIALGPRLDELFQGVVDGLDQAAEPQ
jgi:pilus assembly protein Flp/PilA